MTEHAASVARRLWALLQADIRGHRTALGVSYLFRAAAVLGALLAPWPIKILIDEVIAPAARASGAASPWASSPGPALAVLTLAFLAAAIGAALANSAEKNISASIRERLTLQVRDRVLAHLLTLSPAFRTTHRSGELVLRVVDDTDLFVRVLTKTIPQVFQHGLSLVMTLAAMLWVQPIVALAGAVWLVPAAIVVRRDARRLWSASREKRAREGDVSGLAQEIVRGMTVIQASGDEPRTRAAFEQSNERRMAAGRHETLVAVGIERKLQVLQALAMAAVTAGGGWLVQQGRLSLGELTLLTAYIAQLVKPIEKLNDLAETTGRGVAGGERLLRLLEARPGIEEQAHALPLRRATGVIELDEVWFAYADRPRPVLRAVNLTLNPGELAVLVGASGAGKSTLFSLLVRLFDPVQGEVRLDGHALPTLQLAALRAQFAFLSQDTHLFAGTLRAALTPPHRPVDDEELWRALALVSLTEFVRHLPRGLDATLGEDGVNLSGGQRRRVALARAFLLDRPVLLLDEPLANLDAESAAAILNALAALRGRCTCLAATHDRALVERADRVLRLESGRIREVPAPAGTRPEMSAV